MGANLSSSENPNTQNPSEPSPSISLSPPNMSSIPQNLDSKTPENQTPDPKFPDSQTPEISNQPTNPNEKGQINDEIREKEGNEEEEEEEGECEKGQINDDSVDEEGEDEELTKILTELSPVAIEGDNEIRKFNYTDLLNDLESRNGFGDNSESGIGEEELSLVLGPWSEGHRNYCDCAHCPEAEQEEWSWRNNGLGWPSSLQECFHLIIIINLRGITGEGVLIFEEKKKLNKESC